MNDVSCHATKYLTVVLDVTVVNMIISASTTVMTCILYYFGQYNHTTSIYSSRTSRTTVRPQTILYEDCTATSGYWMNNETVVL